MDDERASGASPDAEATSVGQMVLPHSATLALLALAIFLAVLLYVSRIATFSLIWEDFVFARDGLTWERTQAALWEPVGTHLCPPFRLWTVLLLTPVQAVSDIPRWLGLGSLIGLVVLLVAVYEFVSRETKSPPCGIAAVLIAGVTTAYFPAVARYSFSQALWSAAFALMVPMLLGSRLSFWWRGIGSATAAFVAAAWFSGGLLAGPLGAVYALSRRETGESRRDGRRLAAAPLLGTAAFVAFALTIAGGEVLQPANFAERPVTQAFRPDIAVYLTARCLTEHVVLWGLGLEGILSPEQFVVCLGLLVAGGTVWFRRAPHRRLAVFGLALALFAPLFIYSFRSHMDLATARAIRSYVLFPHIGLTLFLIAGIDRFTAQRSSALRVGDAAKVVVLGIALFLMHRSAAERHAAALVVYHQRRDLSQLDLVATVSQTWEVDGVVVRQALGSFPVSGSQWVDGLEMLDLPTTGRPWTPQEARWRFDRAMAASSVEAFGIEPAAPQPELTMP